MKLNYDLLVKALHEMTNGISVSPRITAKEITDKSGVYNIQRIIDGSISPLAESWGKLHMAFPELIPEPTYESGKTVYRNQKLSAKNSYVAQAGRDYSGSFSFSGNDVKESDKELVKLLLQYGDDEIKQDLKKRLIEKITEKLM